MSDKMRDSLYREIFWMYFWPMFGMSFGVFLLVYIGGLLLSRRHRDSCRRPQQHE